MNTCAYNKAMSNAVKNKEEQVALYFIVIEEVHPSQFEVVPPSPRAIAAKARMLGIEVKRYGF